MIPRTTLAQSMDVLSSMASLAGYQAVLEGASLYTGYFPMLMTAAGSIAPAKVLVIGAGVAGLQAIATARRLGAVVFSMDTRAAVEEEVKSLGAKFIVIPGAKDEKTAGGYGVQQSEDYLAKQREVLHDTAINADVIICTAQLRGRKAPVLIQENTVKAMKPGSAIIDLAASTGGNCALTKNNELVVVNGVSILGDSNLADKKALDASKMLGNNVFNLLKYIIKDGALNLDMEDEIIAGSILQKKN
ncbi:UNVERIFIED_CONTAM: hypothetical protein GTU68_032285 [Idotea baltica]|nr:hypothetical protein [Idotea baltica]